MANDDPGKQSRIDDEGLIKSSVLAILCRAPSSIDIASLEREASSTYVAINFVRSAAGLLTMVWLALLIWASSGIADLM